MVTISKSADRLADMRAPALAAILAASSAMAQDYTITFRSLEETSSSSLPSFLPANDSSFVFMVPTPTLRSSSTSATRLATSQTHSNSTRSRLRALVSPQLLWIKSRELHHVTICGIGVEHDRTAAHVAAWRRSGSGSCVCVRIPPHERGSDYIVGVLRDGKSLVILVGGIAEQMLSQRGDHTIYVKKRKGHIRLALKYGVPIIPGYAFGETDLFTHSSVLLSFRQMIAKKFSVALLLGYGYSKWLFWLPHKGVPVNQVFGKPIPVEKKADPSAEEIEKLHDQYERELTRIFDKYKEKYGYGNCTLHVR
ncbi:hypothetical protein ON010_g555 [Phytophthora cinnamomi]|nr:hypothetical protein ON010_g555 [Phytophthora cinnamomi]